MSHDTTIAIPEKSPAEKFILQTAMQVPLLLWNVSAEKKNLTPQGCEIFFVMRSLSSSFVN